MCSTSLTRSTPRSHRTAFVVVVARCCPTSALIGRHGPPWGRKQTPNFNAQFSRYSCLLLTRSADSAPVRERFGGRTCSSLKRIETGTRGPSVGAPRFGIGSVARRRFGCPRNHRCVSSAYEHRERECLGLLIRWSWFDPYTAYQQNRAVSLTASPLCF